MGAIDRIIENVDSQFLVEKRKQLISPRGTIINGALPEYMKLSSRKEIVADTDDENEENVHTVTEIRSMCLAKSGSKDTSSKHGFVFDNPGTTKLIERITASTDGEIRLYDDFKGHLLFCDEKDSELWNSATVNKQRIVMSNNIQAMMKETEVQYRTHGDRLHYLVIGKISFDLTKDNKTSRMTYPLTMFSCQGEKKYVEKYLRLQIEKSGFINFVLDERELGNEISKANGDVGIDIDNELPSKLSKIQAKITKMPFKNIDNIEIDPAFSMIGIVTGFETEYLDPVWGKIIK